MERTERCNHVDHDFSTGGLAVPLIQLTSQDPGSVRVLVSKLWEVTEEGTRHWPPASMRTCTHNAWKHTHRALAPPFDNYCWYRCHTKYQICHSDRVGTVFRVFFSQCNHELKAFNVFCNIASHQSVPQPHWLQARLTDSKQTTLTPGKTHWGQPSLEHI